MIIFFGTIKMKKKIQLIMDYFLVNFSIHQGLFFFNSSRILETIKMVFC
jgi:hypothetical protein